MSPQYEYELDPNHSRSSHDNLVYINKKYEKEHATPPMERNTSYMKAIDQKHTANNTPDVVRNRNGSYIMSRDITDKIPPKVMTSFLGESAVDKQKESLRQEAGVDGSDIVLEDTLGVPGEPPQNSSPGYDNLNKDIYRWDCETNYLTLENEKLKNL